MVSMEKDMFVEAIGDHAQFAVLLFIILCKRALGVQQECNHRSPGGGGEGVALIILTSMGK